MNPTLLQQIKKRQLVDETLVKKIRQVKQGSGGDFELNTGGTLSFRGRLCVPIDMELRHVTLTERSLREALGLKLNFTTTYHPQTDCHSERVIQILEYMLRSCVIEFSGSWERYLLLVEFAYNNSFQIRVDLFRPGLGRHKLIEYEN
ncbi:DNA/RNA polymerase superfamily protein [Gossypium australe]|uniref:DNA/RNA polymerase superfamily protein n=1 Tax=Gossypium australe TaxID=47621 RepID=A0A5B6W6R6_9ROSI|nr:DNA/RNA polymerase superfamily protein [Gossypium australe]